jgi:hypothetical protein
MKWEDDGLEDFGKTLIGIMVVMALVLLLLIYAFS